MSYLGNVNGRPTSPSWTTASSIVRATAKSVDGPYTVQQMAVQPWAHNAFLARDPPTGEHLLFHIGTGVAPDAEWAPCVIPNPTARLLDPRFQLMQPRRVDSKPVLDISRRTSAISS